MKLGDISSTTATRRKRRATLRRLISCCALLLLIALDTAQAGTELDFRQTRIRLERDFPPKTGLTPRDFQLFAQSLTGSKQDEIIVAYNIGMHAHFLIYQADPSTEDYMPQARYSVDAYHNEVLFAFGRIESREHQNLILAHSGHIEYLPLIDGKVSPDPLELLPHAMLESQRSACRYLDFTVDCDGDGIDELALPALDGPKLWRKTETGWTSIALPALEPKSYSRFLSNDSTPPDHGEKISFSNVNETPGFFFQDFDSDGARDLFRIDGLDAVAAQMENHWPHRLGKLSEQPVRIEAYRYQRGAFADEPGMIIEAAQRPGSQQFFCDVNGDGAPDRIETWASSDPVSPLSWLRLYLAKPADGDTYRISSGSNFVMRSKDPVGVHFYPDLNRDGRLDFFQVQWDYMIGSHDDMADIFLGQRLKLTLEGFIQEAPGRWPDRPQIRRRLQSKNYSPEEGIFPLIDLEHDFDGDGAQDLAFLIEPDRLHVYRCDLQAMRFEDDTLTDISLPPGRQVFFKDINADGRADILAFDIEKRIVELYISK
ncbi:VCBS repeat-containing protein [Candidatus Sumerlaeota bacterium]|nr:VCBS repeat-containing protein [Candidatus Sumerlaeota bacterium]